MMESSDTRPISEDSVNKLLSVYSKYKWFELSNALSSGLAPSPAGYTLKHGRIEVIGRFGKDLMYSVSEKYVSLVCKADYEQKWLHSTAEDPFLHKGNHSGDRRGQKPPKIPKTSKSATFADRVDSIAVLIHNNCVFNWAMFNELLTLIRSDKIRVKSKCVDLMYASFMEVLPLRKLRYLNQQDHKLLEFLSLSLENMFNKPEPSNGTASVNGAGDSSARARKASAFRGGRGGRGGKHARFSDKNANAKDKAGASAPISLKRARTLSSKSKIPWDTLDFNALALLLALTFEDHLKGVYSSFIQELSLIMNRGVDFLQKNASNLVLQMLIQKPEQEDVLLDLIINRLSHKNNKMSSYVFKMLDTLLLNHRNMKGVVVRKILSQLSGLLRHLEALFSRFGSMDLSDPSWAGLDSHASSSDLKGAVKDEKHSESDNRRVTRRGSQRSIRSTTKKALNSISSELVPVLKVVYRLSLYLSKLPYNRADSELVSKLMDHNVQMVMMFTTPGRYSQDSSAHPSSKSSGSVKQNIFKNLVPGLYRLDECNRIIKVLLLFTNKLLNYFKELNLYEDNRSTLISSGLDKNLYNLSRETKSSSISILLMLLLHNIDPNNDAYTKLLYENVFNRKLYESAHILKFLNLVEQILDTNKNFTTVLIRKLLQMGMCNYNNAINCCVVDMVFKYINEDNLWELYLYNSTYNPHLVKSVGSMRVTRSASSAEVRTDVSIADAITSKMSAAATGKSTGREASSNAKSGAAADRGTNAKNGSATEKGRNGGSVEKAGRGSANGKLAAKAGDNKAAGTNGRGGRTAQPDQDIEVHVKSGRAATAALNGSGGSKPKHAASGSGKAAKPTAHSNRLSVKEKSLYQELSLFSECTRAEYGLGKYLAKGKKPEDHQRAFELYYRARLSLSGRGLASKRKRPVGKSALKRRGDGDEATPAAKRANAKSDKSKPKLTNGKPEKAKAGAGKKAKKRGAKKAKLEHSGDDDSDVEIDEPDELGEFSGIDAHSLDDFEDSECSDESSYDERDG